MNHIDDLLFSHFHPTIITDYIKKLYGVNGSKDPLIVVRGKHYEYLGVTLNFEVVPGAC